MAISKFYIPTPGQSDAAARATALGVALAASTLINDPRYAAYVAPVVVLDAGSALSSVSDSPNTTLALVNAASATLTSQQQSYSSTNTLIEQTTTPTGPAVGFLTLYADSQNGIWIIDSNGVSTNLGDVMSNLTLEQILTELRRISLALQILINEEISYDDVPSIPSEG